MFEEADEAFYVGVGKSRSEKIIYISSGEAGGGEARGKGVCHWGIAVCVQSQQETPPWPQPPVRRPAQQPALCTHAPSPLPRQRLLFPKIVFRLPLT